MIQVQTKSCWLRCLPDDVTQPITLFTCYIIIFTQKVQTLKQAKPKTPNMKTMQ